MTITLDRHHTLAQPDAAACPPWCITPSCRGVHVSEAAEVPATTTRSDSVTVSLSADHDQADVVISSDIEGLYLPLALDGAEQLAAHILDVVAVARKG